MAQFVIKHLYTAAQCQQLDKVAMTEFDQHDLMLRAGKAAFEKLKSCFMHARSIIVVCGAGNNGGDGYVVASLARSCWFGCQGFCS